MTGSMIATGSAIERTKSVLAVIKRNAASADEYAMLPAESLHALRSSGLLGLLVPVEYGGMGGSLQEMVTVAGLLASACTSTSMVWAMHCQQVDSMVRFATPELRRVLLPRIAKGDVYLASVTTEARKGGHLLSVAAPLIDDSGRIKIARDAPIVTGGGVADGFLITMRDNADARANEVTLVYADRKQLQIASTGDWNALGMRGTHSAGLHIEGTIPESQIIGGRGTYRTIAVESMAPVGHLAWAACWIGTARAALSGLIKLMRSPQRPSGADPTESDLVAERLARARIDIELAWGYLERTLAEVIESRENDLSLDRPSVQVHLNVLKVTAAELSFSAIDRIVQIAGLSTGYLRSSPLPLERQFRDLRSASLNYADDRLLSVIGRLMLLDQDIGIT